MHVLYVTHKRTFCHLAKFRVSASGRVGWVGDTYYASVLATICNTHILKPELPEAVIGECLWHSGVKS